MKNCVTNFFLITFLSNIAFSLAQENISDFVVLNVTNFKEFQEYYKPGKNFQVFILQASEFNLENQIFGLIDSKIEVFCLQQPCFFRMRNSSFFLENNNFFLFGITLDLQDHTAYFFSINRKSIFSLEVNKCLQK